MIAFAADHVLDGGGLANYSASVASSAPPARIGIYDVPKVDVTTVAVHSRGVTAGSMRGYGTLQTMTALEVLVDEVAAALPLDPIEFRRRNALKTGGRTMTGNPYTVSVRTPEILDKLEKPSDLARPRRREGRGTRGLSSSAPAWPACTKDYGTGADCSLGAVEIDPEGRIAIHGDASRWATASAPRWPIAWRVISAAIADEVTVAQVDVFDALELVTSGDPYTMSQPAQDEAAARNPRWVPAISSATSASIGAHVGTQAAAEAARVVFRFGLWPAALEPVGHRAGRSARQAMGRGVLAGRAARPVRACRRCRCRRSPPGRMRANGVTGAMAHAFSRWAWSQATFPIGGEDWTADIDSLAVRYGAGKFTRLDRTRRRLSADRLQPHRHRLHLDRAARWCAIEIERATGALRIAKAYSVLECGQVLVPEVVLGQAQGGFAMGVGYALLETLPPFEDGPGNGQWNLGDYVIARGSDLPLHDLEIEVLPPMSPRRRTEGHGGGGDDPGRAGAAERDLRRHRPPLSERCR